MSLKLAASDGVKVFSLQAPRAQPAWVTEKKKRELRKDDEYNRRCGRSPRAPPCSRGRGRAGGLLRSGIWAPLLPERFFGAAFW